MSSIVKVNIGFIWYKINQTDVRISHRMTHVIIQNEIGKLH